MTDEPFDEYGDDDELDDVQPAGQAPDAAGGGADPAAAQQEAPPDDTPPEPMYPDHYTFMAEFLGSIISRTLSTTSGQGLRWDPDWWRYPEVEVRVEMMWRTFEVARADKDPNVLDAWMRQVVDHHLGVIFAPTGPMANKEGPGPTIKATYPRHHPNYTPPAPKKSPDVPPRSGGNSATPASAAASTESTDTAPAARTDNADSDPVSGSTAGVGL